jgi:hypothetical protein
MSTTNLPNTSFKNEYSIGTDRFDKVLTLKDGLGISREGLQIYNISATTGAVLALNASDIAQGNIVVILGTLTGNATITLPTLTLILASLPDELKRKGTCIKFRIWAKYNVGTDGSLGYGLSLVPDVSLTSSASGYTQTANISSVSIPFTEAGGTASVQYARSMIVTIIINSPTTPSAYVDYNLLQDLANGNLTVTNLNATYVYGRNRTTAYYFGKKTQLASQAVSLGVETLLTLHSSDAGLRGGVTNVTNGIQVQIPGWYHILASTYYTNIAIVSTTALHLNITQAGLPSPIAVDATKTVADAYAPPGQLEGLLTISWYAYISAANEIVYLTGYSNADGSIVFSHSTLPQLQTTLVVSLVGI